MIAVIGWFVVAETVYPSERIKASRPENLTYRGTFTWQRDQWWPLWTEAYYIRL